MDVFSHGLWTGAISKLINNKLKKPISILQTAFWGVFPDLFAFTIAFVWLSGSLFLGKISPSAMPGLHEVEPSPLNTNPIFHLTSLLYSIGHSAIIFILAFSVLWFILRRPYWELFGWFFHILIDIPTHSYRFYPTPVFWPLSSWKFDGFSWGNIWFIAIDYTAIIAVYFFLIIKKYKKARA